jgi:hypothetical protein
MKAARKRPELPAIERADTSNIAKVTKNDTTATHATRELTQTTGISRAFFIQTG